MLKMLKSKAIIGFIVFELGFTYVNCIVTKNFDDNKNINNEVAVVSDK